MRINSRHVVSFLVGAAFAAAAHSALAQDIGLQWNKLEAYDGGCRTYFVAENGLDAAVDRLQLDLVAFGEDGVISMRMELDLGPLPAGKTMVRAFDIVDLECSAMRELLLNEVKACEAGGAPVENCLSRLDLSSTGPEFFK